MEVAADAQAKVVAVLLHVLYGLVVLPPPVLKLERSAVKVGEEANTSCPPAFLAPLPNNERQLRVEPLGGFHKTIEESSKTEDHFGRRQSKRERTYDLTKSECPHSQVFPHPDRLESDNGRRPLV